MDFRNWNYAVEDDSEEGTKQDYWKGRDYLIFMIDCADSMMTKVEEEDTTCFENCLKVVSSMYRLRCTTGDKDFLAVLLFNTSTTKNSHSFEHIYTLHDLSLPNAGHVKQLEALLDENGRKLFEKQFGHGEAKLDEAFWMAGTMFSTKATREGTKRVILLTNCDKPHRTDPDIQKRVVQKIKDLRDQEIGVDVLPVGNEAFDWKFYQFALDKSAGECAGLAAERYEELLQRTVCKSYKRRAMATMPFKLGPGIELGVGLYNMFTMARIPTATIFDKHTNEQVVSHQTFMDAESGERVLPVEMKKAQTYGGKRIAFEKTEVEQLKTDIAKGADDTEQGRGSSATPTGLVLLGFKPQSYLQPYHYVQPGPFAYPDEKWIAGSTKLFRTLLERCSARGVMAICRLVARGNMAPRIVALLPQLEELDEHGFQISPPGFNVVYLPYADDIRDLQKVSEQRHQANVSQDQVEKATAIIKKLKTDDFSPENFPNPALQKHYRAVEAIALERETVEEVEDLTVPNLDWMERKAKTEMEEFVSAVFIGHFENSGKRKRAFSGEATSKKAKAESINLEEEARGRRLEKLTVPVLRELCTQNKIKLSGTRKGEIIQAINKHFGL